MRLIIFALSFCFLTPNIFADVLVKESKLIAQDIPDGGEKLVIGAGKFCVDGVLIYERIKMRIAKSGSKIKVMKPNDSLDKSLRDDSTFLTCNEPITLKLVKGEGVQFLDSKVDEKYNRFSCNGRTYTPAEIGKVLGQKIDLPESYAPECHPESREKTKKTDETRGFSR